MLLEGPVRRLEGYARASLERFLLLSRPAQAGVLLYLAVSSAAVLMTLYLGPSNILAYLATYASVLREQPFGFLVIIVGITATSIPPLIGYSTLITLCGFAWGVSGWFIAVAGCLIGSAVSFLVCRSFMRRFVHFLDASPQLSALGQAVRSKGLLIIILIRLSPFPFPLSNLFFASVKTVTLSEFMLATFLISPKILLHVWIGSRIYLLADPTQKDQLDSTTKWVNGISAGIGMAIGVFTSWYVYTLVMKYADEAALEEDLEARIQLASTELDLNDDEDEDQHGDVLSSSSSNHGPNAPRAKRPAALHKNSQLSSSSDISLYNLEYSSTTSVNKRLD